MCYSTIIDRLNKTNDLESETEIVTFENYSGTDSNTDSDQITFKTNLILKTWTLTFDPQKWLKIPPSEKLVKSIRITWDKINNNNNNCNDIANPITEFRLVLATIPIKIIDCYSINQFLDLSNIGHKKFLSESKLNFSKVFCAWVEFQHDIDWTNWEANIIYEVEN